MRADLTRGGLTEQQECRVPVPDVATHLVPPLGEAQPRGPPLLSSEMRVCSSDISSMHPNKIYFTQPVTFCSFHGQIASSSLSICGRFLSLSRCGGGEGRRSPLGVSNLPPVQLPKSFHKFKLEVSYRLRPCSPPSQILIPCVPRASSLLTMRR